MAARLEALEAEMVKVGDHGAPGGRSSGMDLICLQLTQESSQWVIFRFSACGQNVPQIQGMFLVHDAQLQQLPGYMTMQQSG